MSGEPWRARGAPDTSSGSDTASASFDFNDILRATLITSLHEAIEEEVTKAKERRRISIRYIDHTNEPRHSNNHQIVNVGSTIAAVTATRAAATHNMNTHRIPGTLVPAGQDATCV